MTGPEHYKEAERITADVRRRAVGMEGAEVDTDVAVALMAQHLADLAAAQIHATLALTAATAQNIRRNGAMDAGTAREWVAVTR